jgi:outer membrane biosynthesis protein TonB
MRRALSLSLCLAVAAPVALVASSAYGKRPVSSSDPAPAAPPAADPPVADPAPAPDPAPEEAPPPPPPKPAKPAPVAKAPEPKPAPKAAEPKPAPKAPEPKVAAAPEAPKAPPPDLPERVIEKKDVDYLYKLTLRPGSLKPNRVANAKFDIGKNLDTPDPITGDTGPVKSAHPIAKVKAPDVQKGKKIETGATTTYMLWPGGNPGEYGLHFTPTSDGVYEVTVSGAEVKGADDAGPKSFSATFKLGVGTAVAETEQSTGVATKRTARRPVGGDDESGDSKIEKLMGQIGQRYLDLDGMLNRPPAKGPQGDAAAEARAIAALFAQVKGLSPSNKHSDSSEFDRLVDAASSQLEVVASAAEAKDRAGPRSALRDLETQTCDRCHAKFRYDVTDDVSTWPSFQQKSNH